MKKIIRYTLAGGMFVSLLVGTHIAQAQDDIDVESTRPTPPGYTNVRPTIDEVQKRRATIQEEREARLNEIQTNREAVQTDRATQADEITSRITEQRELRTLARKERAQEFIRRAIARVNTIADKIESFIPRISDRLDTLSQRGVDTSSADQSLVDAQNALDSARTQITTLTNLEDVLGAEENKADAIAKVRAIIEDARNDLKEARAHLVEAIRFIKSPHADTNTDTDNDDENSEENTADEETN